MIGINYKVLAILLLFALQTLSICSLHLGKCLTTSDMILNFDLNDKKSLDFSMWLGNIGIHK